MIEIANLEEWTKEYFSDPENQKKAENEEPADDPGKCMEKAKYEVIPFAKVDGKKGKIKINMLDQIAEFVPE